MIPALTDLVLDHGLIDKVRAVLAQHPTLTANGFDDRGLPTRTNLLDYRGLCEVQGALDYLEGRRRTVAKSDSPGSYTLKHQVESWHRMHGREVYVSNGAFMVAAMIRGYGLYQRHSDGLNRAVGIHRADIVTREERKAQLNRPSRPDGAPSRKFGPVAPVSERLFAPSAIRTGQH
jgi:hypothetical protein